ncbi:MAG: LysM peptidoglycan-binding domain-containing protein [Shewanellaceae bacterium]|nr:LysM peptidoglycan-binding domain-containing protein [Shewanellaceae bacterium]
MKPLLWSKKYGILWLLCPMLAYSSAVKVVGSQGEHRQTEHEYGPTHRQDTLWKIAQATSRDKTLTIYQVMLAIFQANPQAFSFDNLNSLEVGQMLRIPDPAQIRTISPDQAYMRSIRDYQRWRQRRALK